MTVQNSISGYGSVAKTFHWVTALLIVTVIPLGIIANDAPFDTGEALARKAWLFSLHKTLGITLFAVALLRIAWAFAQPKPAPLHPERRVETALATIVHWLLYGSLVIVPLSGWVHHAATEGFAPIWWPFGQSLPFVPKSEELAAVTAGLHLVFERVLVLALFLHILGALKHAIIDRDDTLARMLPGRRVTPLKKTGAEHSQHKVVAPLMALVIWGAAVGTGAALGAFAEKEHVSTQIAELDEQDSEWIVENGTLGLSVTQLGSRVDGTFANWTAKITFDDSVVSGPAGDVRVEIAIGSMNLGSVTVQALGADYLDANAHPVAVFEADILRDASGNVARGTLTIKDVAVPVELPFTLDIQNGVAEMTGETVVQRLDFGVGTTTPDPNTLGLEVGISVALTARRSDEN